MRISDWSSDVCSSDLVNPNASAEQVHSVFWPGQVATGKKANDDRNGLLSKTRRWLGQNDAGELYVPLITTGEYRLLEDVRSEWQGFLGLVGDEISDTSTDRLLAALELVKGQTISGVPDNRSVERWGGEECASTGSSTWSPVP